MKAGTYDFIGVFLCVDGNKPKSNLHSLIETLIQCVTNQPWKRIGYQRKTDSSFRTVRFREGKLAEVLDFIQQGSLATLALSTVPPGVEAYWETHTKSNSFFAQFKFEYQRLKQGMAVSRIPPGCTFLLTFPVTLFHPDRATADQEKILRSLCDIVVSHDIPYGFMNLGRRAYMPWSIGVDDIFYETREEVPVTSFNSDLLVLPENFYHDYVRSAFWASFLNGRHIERLGGIDRLRSVPMFRVAPLANDGALVVLAASPVDDTDRARTVYQNFRALLSPIRVETNEEVNRALHALE